MFSLPKIVSERLRGTPVIGEHPDADQMGMLMEGGISQGERTRLLEHLSTCNECREIVFLALPHMELAESQPVQGRHPSWLRWPALRWGTAAACAAIVGVVVTLHYRDTMQESSPPIVASDRVSATHRYVDSPQAKASDGASTSNVVSPNAFAPEAPESRLEGQSAAVVAKNAPVGGTSAIATSPASPVPARSQQNVTASLKKDEGKAEISAESDERRNGSRDELAVPQSATGAVQNADEATGKAKEPLQKTDQASLAIGENTNRIDRKASVAGGLVLAPRWTLSADGTLQRSLNAGKTWETISIPPSSTLRALAAIGTEIWIGGSAGVLFHSSDAGNGWTQIKPIANGVSLRADIIGVEFTDTQHGKLSTIGGETWTTVDGGQSWTVN